MKVVRRILFWGGLLALIMGAIWTGQGSGYFPYPEQSFMIDNSPWVTYGAILAVAGLIAMWLSRRLR